MTNQIEKALAAGLEPVIDKVYELEKRVDDISLVEGPPGKDADPEQVAKILIDHYLEKIKGEPGKTPDLCELAAEIKKLPDFIALTKGERGADAPTVDPQAVVDLIVKNHKNELRGEPGETAMVNHELIIDSLTNDADFVKRISGKDGKDAQPVSAKDVALYLIENHLETIKGKDGESPELEIDLDAIETALKSDEKFVKVLQGKKGERGEKGEPGKDGAPGVGINIKLYQPGVHREGTIVQANIGQCFRAKKDTAQNTNGDDWERIGLGGFKWCGVKQQGRQYEEGDLYIENGTTFLYTGGKGRIFAQRGKNGEAGKDGKNGKDASQIIEVAFDFNTGGMTLVFNDGRMQASDEFGHAVKEYCHTITSAFLAQSKELAFVDQLAEQESTGVAVRVYRGVFNVNNTYTAGDLVNYNRGLFLFTKNSERGKHESSMQRVAGTASSSSAMAPSGGGGSTSDDITNQSTVVGATVTDALNTLDAVMITQYAGETSLDTTSVSYEFNLNSVTVAELDTTNGLSVHSDINVDSGQVFLPAGSAANPTLTFTADTDSGIYSDSGLAFADGGAEVLRFNSGQAFLAPALVLGNGSISTLDAAAPTAINITVGDTTNTSNTLGTNLTLKAGAGYRASGPSTQFAGGDVVIEGGGQNGAGRNGNVVLQTPTGVAGSNAYTSGAINSTTGAGGSSATSTAAGASGGILLTTGAGGANTGATTSGAAGGSGSQSFTTGAGGSTNNTGSSAAGAAGNLSFSAGAGGNATAGTGAGGNSGNIIFSLLPGGSSVGGAAGQNGEYRILYNSANAFVLSSAGVALSLGHLKLNTASALTASTTQTQGQSPITADVNQFATVANANDAATLPSAEAGRRILIINNGANTLQLFPATGDNAGAGVNTSVSVSAGAAQWFTAYNTTNWVSA